MRSLLVLRRSLGLQVPVLHERRGFRTAAAQNNQPTADEAVLSHIDDDGEFCAMNCSIMLYLTHEFIGFATVTLNNPKLFNAFSDTVRIPILP